MVTQLLNSCGLRSVELISGVDLALIGFRLRPVDRPVPITRHLNALCIDAKAPADFLDFAEVKRLHAEIDGTAVVRM